MIANHPRRAEELATVTPPRAKRSKRQAPRPKRVDPESVGAFLTAPELKLTAGRFRECCDRRGIWLGSDPDTRRRIWNASAALRARFAYCGFDGFRAVCDALTARALVLARAEDRAEHARRLRFGGA